MAWTTTLVTSLRVLIGDMDSGVNNVPRQTIVAYTDIRLRDILVVAASYVNATRHLTKRLQNTSLYFGVASPFVYSDAATVSAGATNVYTIHIGPPESTISPDPTLAATLDEEFSNLIVTMAANLLVSSEERLGARTAHLEAELGAATLKAGAYVATTEKKRAPMPLLFPTVNEGSPGGGHNGLTGPNPGQRDWEWMFNSLDADRDGYAATKTPRQMANEQGGMKFHNAGGLFIPMDMEQFIKTAAEAVSNPTDILIASADFELFTEAASRYKQDSDLWLGFYFGSMETTLPVLAGDTPEIYADRAIAALAPVFNIRPRIDWLALDAFRGVPFYPVEEGPYVFSNQPEKQLILGGPDGAEAIIIQRIQDMGIELACEPGYILSVPHMQGLSVTMGEAFHGIRENRAPPWEINNSQGVREEMVHPSTVLGLHNSVVIGATRALNTLSDEEKLAVVASIQSSGYNVTINYLRFPGAFD